MKASVLALLALVGTAAADPLRLRGDAYATTASPAGLLVLSADGLARPGLSAEAVVWLANARSPGDDTQGDVLVIVVHARSRSGRLAAQLGRFVATLGAIWPQHLDGGAVRVRLPARFDLEALAGVPVAPVAPVAIDRAWDWVVGGRVARRVGAYGSLGVAYLQRRDAGALETEEVGADAGAALGARDDVAARIAYDLIGGGVAEVGVSASHRRGGLRAELYASHRAASHLLPATSLFSVLGDVPAQRAGTVLTWKAAPRLDLVGEAAGERVDHDLGVELVGRARLRLDARGTSQLGAELRRSGVGDEAWTGIRGTARIALAHPLTLSTELEIVRPDEPRGRGRVWPWALVALAWESSAWTCAVALEASASPSYRDRVDALVQLSRRWTAR